MNKYFFTTFMVFFTLQTSALEFQGKFQQGAVIIGRVEQGMQVELQGRKLNVADNGQFVFGLGRDAKSPVVITTLDAAGKRESHSYAVAPRQYNIQRVTGVPHRTVEPSAEQVARARKEAQLVAKARSGDLPRMDFAQTFQWPLIGPITGVYGSQRFYNGEPNSPHYGVDIAAPVGTKVRAPADGLVTLVHPDMFFSGGTLIIDHGHGLSSTFIHLSKELVEVGDEVKQGQVIAEVGATGRATGPHLDWRMNWFTERVDPTLIVGPMPETSGAAATP